MENVQLGQLAQIAYEVYAESLNWTNAVGDTLPQWADLPQQNKRAWSSAITSVLDLSQGTR